MRPQIQNDFASYRRHLPRMKREHEQGLLPQLPVADTDANGVSMFIAEVQVRGMVANCCEFRRLESAFPNLMAWHNSSALYSYIPYPRLYDLCTRISHV